MKILVVDDHALFREGLCYVLNQLEDSVSILEASDYEGAFDVLAANPDLDLVLLDLHMPGKDGFSVLGASSQQYPAIPVVVLSASRERSDIQRVLAAGAMGYIPKESTGKLMLSAVRMVLSGGIYMPPEMAYNPPLEPTNQKVWSLTPRQLEVLSMIVQGLPNKVIASRLGIAEATINMHVTSILKSLGVSNRTQAAMAAQKLGVKLPAV
jgi:DNA-binding NarL/FixJ family response regulator